MFAINLLPSSLYLLNGFQQAEESMVTSSISAFVDVRIPQIYWSTSSPSNNAGLLQIGHLQVPLSEFSCK